MKLPFLFLATLVFGVAPLVASQLTLVASEGLEEEASANLTVQLPDQEPLRQKVQLPFAGPVPLAGHLRVECSRCWPCDAELGATTLVLKMTTEGRIRGLLHSSVLRSVTSPLAIRLTPVALQPVQEAGRSQQMVAPASACQGQTLFLQCPLGEKGSLDCPAPSGIWDLRVEASGFAPTYFWKQVISPTAPTLLGELKPVRGASVAGFLVGSVAIASSVVKVERNTFGAYDEREKAKLHQLGFEGSAGENGFFQIPGLPAGSWLLRASQGQHRSSRIQVELAEGEELFLSAPVALEPPLEANVVIEPPLSPQATPWQGTLFALSAGRMREIVKAKASPQGRLLLHGMEPGSYSLDISDNEGSSWYRQDLAIESSVELFIAMDLIEVRGELKLGEEGTAGKLIFGANEVPRIGMLADSNGIFSGHLPRDGDWSLLVEWPSGERRRLPPIAVERQQGKSWAQVEVVLPATAVQGKVTRSGRGVAASVIVRKPGENRASTSTLADERGEFSLKGLEPGSYEIAAIEGNQESGWQGLEIAEGRDLPPVLLELAESFEFRGCLSSAGQQVPGAQVMANFPDGTSSWDGPLRATTDAAGCFKLKTEEKRRLLALLVTTPGLPTYLGLVTFSKETVTQIELPRESGDLFVLAEGRWEGLVLQFGNVRIPLQSILGAYMRIHGQFLQRPEDAAFILPKLPTGLWTLCTAEATGCASAELLPGGSTDLTIGKTRAEP